MTAGEPYAFVDEKFMTAQEKWRVLRAWQRFIRSGFELEKFTEATYHHVIQHCSFIAHYDRGGFWDFYFNSAPGDLARFLNQFGGDRRSAEYGFMGTSWMKGPTGDDLNQAMCQEMEVVYPALAQVLDGLGREYQAAVARWREDAPATALFAPPSFRIDGHVRSLLATAAGQALGVRGSARTVARSTAVVESRPGKTEPVQLSLWDRAPEENRASLSGDDRCAVCHASPASRPGMWYVIHGVVYCPDCVPVGLDDEVADRGVSRLRYASLLEQAQGG